MTAITATAAATQAGVTVATVRTWARRGIIAATKVAGRWVINTASLAARIAIGAMRARKQAPMAANYPVDSETVIHVKPVTCRITGQSYFVASPMVNGYKVTGQREGDTQEAAYRACLEGITLRRGMEERAGQLADAGLYADLTTGPVQGIHKQMQAAMGAVSPARPGECHFCGLATSTCDCR